MRPGRGHPQAHQVLGDGDEVGERVDLVRQAAGIVPRVALLAAAADVGDGIDEPAVHQRQPLDAELGMLRVAVGAVAVEPDRRRAVERGVPAIEDGDGNLRAVSSRSEDAAGDVEGGIVAARHVVHLPQRALAASPCRSRTPGSAAPWTGRCSAACACPARAPPRSPPLPAPRRSRWHARRRPTSAARGCAGCPARGRARARPGDRGRRPCPRSRARRDGARSPAAARSPAPTPASRRSSSRWRRRRWSGRSGDRRRWSPNTCARACARRRPAATLSDGRDRAPAGRSSRSRRPRSPGTGRKGSPAARRRSPPPPPRRRAGPRRRACRADGERPSAPTSPGLARRRTAIGCRATTRRCRAPRQSLSARSRPVARSRTLSMSRSEPSSSTE